MIKSLLKSRQFWTIVVIFVVNGFASIKEMIPAGWLIWVDALLGVLAVYFRVYPRQGFGKK